MMGDAGFISSTVCCDTSLGPEGVTAVWKHSHGAQGTRRAALEAVPEDLQSAKGYFSNFPKA